MNSKMKCTIVRLMGMFVRKRYQDIANWTQNTDLTAEMIEESVVSYGQDVVDPSEEFWEFVDFLEIAETVTGRRRWHVSFEFWMSLIERSDLSVEAFFIDNDDEYYDDEINNIHVM